MQPDKKVIVPTLHAESLVERAFRVPVRRNRSQLRKHWNQKCSCGSGLKAKNCHCHDPYLKKEESYESSST